MRILGRKILFFLTTALLAVLLFSRPIFARSGCCSHHGGVCGCGCCDGTPLSSTCAPYYPECSGNTIVWPTDTPKPVYTPPTSTPKPKATATPVVPTNTPTSEPTRAPTQEPAATSEPTKAPTSTPASTAKEDKPTTEVKGTTTQNEKQSSKSSSSVGDFILVSGLGWGGFKLLMKWLSKKSK